MIIRSLRATARSLKEQQLSAESLYPGAVFGTVFSPFYVSFQPQETVTDPRAGHAERQNICRCGKSFFQGTMGHAMYRTANLARDHRADAVLWEPIQHTAKELQK